MTMFHQEIYMSFGCVLIGSTSLLLNGVKTTQSGRDDLLKNKRIHLRGGKKMKKINGLFCNYIIIDIILCVCHH